MFKLTSIHLTKTDVNYAAHLTKVDVGNTNFATIATVNFGRQENTVLSNTYGTELDVPDTWSDVSTVSANGQLLRLASNPQNPQLGEYVFNPYTKKITIYSYSPTVIIAGSLQDVKFAPKFVQGLPSLFSFLPLDGQISLSRSFENHPSGQFSFETRYTKDQVFAVFTPGREFDLFNIGYRVNNVSVSELPRSTYPDGRCKVSVSFGGKWENRIGQPCFLRQDGSNNIPGNEPFLDPECLTNTPNSGDPNRSVSLYTLLDRIGVVVTGSGVKPVPIPEGTTRDTVVSPDQLLQERLRLANSFVRYSNNSSVEIQNIRGLAGHTILESDILEQIDSSYEAVSKNSKTPLIAQYLNAPAFNLTNFPSTVTSPVPAIAGEVSKNLGFEYPCVELSGQFSEPKEKKPKTQGQNPRYVRKPPNRQTRIEGDVNADQPLDGVSSIKVMSLCFDLGGEQKIRTFVTEENGVVIQTVAEIWGFRFTAEDVYTPSTGKYSGNPLNYWKCLKQVITNYTYDVASLSGEGGTGILLYKQGYGFNTVRWKQENVNDPETIGLIGDISPEATKQRSLYSFFTIPVVERYSRKLKLQPEYQTEGLYEVIKKCNRDGTASYVPLINPDYAPPYYIEEEVQQKTSFKSRSNPENEGRNIQAGDTLLPDLYVGSMEWYSTKITGITPTKYEYRLIGFDENRYPIYQKGNLIEPQKWYKYIYKFSASGQAIASALEDISTESGTGDLPQASERMIRYMREEPTPAPDTEKQATEPLYKYLIYTDGYSQDSPINGSESFPLAETLGEALTAARAKLAIENWRNGYSENITINFRPEIKEGDRVFYFCNGQYRERVAITVTHELNILGNVNGQPVVTGQTKLQLGNLVYPALYHSEIKLPAIKDNNEPQVTVVNVVNEQLGGLLDWSTIRSRRNP